MPPPTYPNINGVAPSWAQIRVSISGHGRTLGLMGIDYSDKVSREKVRGEGSVPLEMTDGEYDSECKLKMAFREARAFQRSLELAADSLGVGVYQVPFEIQVAYRLDNGSQIIEDQIIGCKVQSFAQAHESGPKGLEVELPIDCMRILWNGRAYQKSAQEEAGI
jgi:hypothetical protein